jgi:hypothetical protein
MWETCGNLFSSRGTSPRLVIAPQNPGMARPPYNSGLGILMERVLANRFERHPVLSLVGICILGLFFLEICLRIADPSILNFGHSFRQINRYHPKWLVDYEPNSSAWIRLRGSGNVDFQNFVITINEHAFRCWDRALDNNLSEIQTGTRVIHAIGDSFTQGWGLNYEASYPALLDFILGDRMRVLNLGVNGFGTIGATGKSMALWAKFPAALSIYLFIYNDYENDVTATEHSRLPGILHTSLDIWNWFRQHTYLATCPYALVYWWRWPCNVGPKDLDDRKTLCQDNQFEVRVGPPTNLRSDPNKGTLSKKAICEYREFLAQRGAGLVVLVLGPQDTSQDFYWFCRENSIETYYFTVPGELLLKRDGHFNALGNYKLARFVAPLIRDKIR